MTHPTLRLAASLALLAVATPALAQRGGDGHAALYDLALGRAAPTCLDSIPESALAPASYYLAASAPERTGWTNATVPLWSGVAGDVAAMIRGSLGSAADSLPNAEPLLGWRSATSEVFVTAHRDGRITWRVERDAANGADSLLVGALGALAGHGFPQWPDSLGDSSTVELGLVGVRAGETLDAAQRMRGFMLPVFSVRQPVVRRAERMLNPGAEHAGAGMHPAGGMTQVSGIGDIVNGRPVSVVPIATTVPTDGGSVELEFVVDTLGRAEPATLHEVLSATTPTTYEHRALFDDMKSRTLRDRFRPATVGGCRAPMMMRLTITRMSVGREKSQLGTAQTQITIQGSSTDGLDQHGRPIGRP